jgi:hypothetical protein
MTKGEAPSRATTPKASHVPQYSGQLHCQCYSAHHASVYLLGVCRISRRVARRLEEICFSLHFFCISESSTLNLCIIPPLHLNTTAFSNAMWPDDRLALIPAGHCLRTRYCCTHPTAWLCCAILTQPAVHQDEVTSTLTSSPTCMFVAIRALRSIATCGGDHTVKVYDLGEDGNHLLTGDFKVRQALLVTNA